MFDIVPILTQAAQQMVFEEEAIKFVAFINWPANLVVNLFASPDVSPVIIEQETSLLELLLFFHFIYGRGEDTPQKYLSPTFKKELNGQESFNFN